MRSGWLQRVNEISGRTESREDTYSFYGLCCLPVRSTKVERVLSSKPTLPSPVEIEQTCPVELVPAVYGVVRRFRYVLSYAPAPDSSVKRSLSSFFLVFTDFLRVVCALLRSLLC
jgi:hypothetical protein